ADRGIGNDRDGRDAEDDSQHEAPRLAHKITLLLREGAKLARIRDCVADILEGLQQRLGPRHPGIVFDQRLLVRQANRDFFNSGNAAECFLDGAGAERAMETPDPGTDLPAVGAGRGLLAPGLESRLILRCNTHGHLYVISVPQRNGATSAQLLRPATTPTRS